MRYVEINEHTEPYNKEKYAVTCYEADGKIVDRGVGRSLEEANQLSRIWQERIQEGKSLGIDYLREKKNEKEFGIRNLYRSWYPETVGSDIPVRLELIASGGPIHRFVLELWSDLKDGRYKINEQTIVAECEGCGDYYYHCDQASKALSVFAEHVAELRSSNTVSLY